MAKSSLVKGLTPRLPERGKIKIGIKGQWIESSKGNEFQPPKKIDHFLITKTVRENDKEANFVEDVELMKLLKKKHADSDGKLRRIPIRLLYNDIELNVQTRYAAYKGRKTLFCSGDGEFATRNDGKGVLTEIKCPCGHKDPEYQELHPKETKCKIATRFQCEIIGCEEVGGVFMFRSTGYNTAVELPSSLSYISAMTGGILAGLDLMLVMGPRTKDKGDIYVVSVIYAGSRTELKENAIKMLESDTMYAKRRNLVEARARKLLVATNDLEKYLDENSEDITDEHYPEEAKKEKPTDDKEMPIIEDEKDEIVDIGTGEVQEQAQVQEQTQGTTAELEPKPTKEELTETYYNDNLTALCLEKPFGGKNFSQLSKANKNWVYKRMIAPPPEIQEAIEQSAEGVGVEEETMPTIEDTTDKGSEEVKEDEETFIEEVPEEMTETKPKTNQETILDSW